MSFIHDGSTDKETGNDFAQTIYLLKRFDFWYSKQTLFLFKN